MPWSGPAIVEATQVSTAAEWNETSNLDRKL